MQRPGLETGCFRIVVQQGQLAGFDVHRVHPQVDRIGRELCPYPLVVLLAGGDQQGV